MHSSEHYFWMRQPPKSNQMSTAADEGREEITVHDPGVPMLHHARVIIDGPRSSVEVRLRTALVQGKPNQVVGIYLGTRVSAVPHTSHTFVGCASGIDVKQSGMKSKKLKIHADCWYTEGLEPPRRVRLLFLSGASEHALKKAQDAAHTASAQ
jgi:hypothetical protein